MPPKFVKVACGREHSIAIQEDGTLVQWGHPGAMANFRPMKALDIACTGYASVAIDKNTGLAVQWGEDTGRFQPPPTTPLKEVVACHRWMFWGLQKNGTIVVWGYPAETTRLREQPMRFLSKWRVLSIHGNKPNSGTIYAIQRNGTLGYRTISPYDRVIFIDVPTDKVKAFSALNDTGVAILENGTLKQWGNLSQPPPPGVFRSVDVFSRRVGYEDRYGAIGVQEDGKVIQWGEKRIDEPPSILNASQVVVSPWRGDANEFAVAITSKGALFQWGDSGANGLTGFLGLTPQGLIKEEVERVEGAKAGIAAMKGVYEAKTGQSGEFDAGPMALVRKFAIGKARKTRKGRGGSRKTRRRS